MSTSTSGSDDSDSVTGVDAGSRAADAASDAELTALLVFVVDFSCATCCPFVLRQYRNRCSAPGFSGNVKSLQSLVLNRCRASASHVSGVIFGHVVVADVDAVLSLH